LAQAETHVGTRGEIAEQIGFRNKLRASWRALPAAALGATVGIQLAIAILFWFVDHSLGYAALTVSAIYWLRRLPPCRGGSRSKRASCLPSPSPAHARAPSSRDRVRALLGPEGWRGWLLRSPPR
jgi:hypothetical protein